MYYDELLTLCGYEPDEIEKARPRVERTFEKLEFSPDDIHLGEYRIRYYYDIDLVSIRKMLGLWLKSLIDLILAKEEGKKVVYTSMPPLFHILNGLATVSHDIYVTSPDIVLSYSLGGIFGKLVPFLEAAEADLLPAGSAFCSPIQVKLGAIIKGVIPVPDLFVSSGFVCDQTPKLDELLSIRYGVPVIYADGSHDAYETHWPQISNRRAKYIIDESNDILKKIQIVLGYNIPEEKAQQAGLRSKNILIQCNRIFELIKSADPTPTGFNNIGGLIRLVKLAVNTTTVNGDPEGLTNLFFTELQQRVNMGKGSLVKGPPRVGIITLSSIPETIKIIEDSGLAVVVDFTGLANTRADFISSSCESIWESGAETLLRFCGIKFATRLLQVFREWDLDGAILNYPIGCRDLSMETLKTKELISKEFGRPVLVIESDLTDPRYITGEAIRNRVEAFAEILKSTPISK
jgi:benzoyl-CoA reductase/2-hydroxyglutaryl-CoA dehydratase subunit BcrC/BadD/HgdB